MKKWAIGLIAVVLLIGLFYFINWDEGGDYEMWQVYLGSELFNLEVVRNSEDMARGLMFRESLDRNQKNNGPPHLKRCGL